MNHISTQQQRQLIQQQIARLQQWDETLAIVEFFEDIKTVMSTLNITQARLEVPTYGMRTMASQMNFTPSPDWVVKNYQEGQKNFTYLRELFKRAHLSLLPSREEAMAKKLDLEQYGMDIATDTTVEEFMEMFEQSYKTLYLHEKLEQSLLHGAHATSRNKI